MSSTALLLLAHVNDDVGVVVLGPARRGGRVLLEEHVWRVDDAGEHMAQLGEIYPGAAWACGSEPERAALVGVVGLLPALPRLLRLGELPTRPQHPPALLRAEALAAGFRLDGP